MKKILIFSIAYYPHFVSGAEAAVKEVTDRISPDDIEFHMITHKFAVSDPSDEHIGNVWVHRVGFGPIYLSKILFIPLAALKAYALHRQYGFNALWSLMTYMLFPVALLRLIGVRIPHVLTLQDGSSYEKVFKRWFILPVLPLLDSGFRSATAIQAISTYLSTWPRLRGYKGEVVIIHNGANPRDLKEIFDSNEVEKIKQKFDKKPGDVWLVNTARLVHQKGTENTIHAIAMLPTYVKLLLVGSGEDMEILKKLTNKLHLGTRIFFVGHVDRSQVTNYRKAGDIFVCPSRSEGLGNAFLSAMASRLPVIATQEGGLADFVFDAKRNPDKPTTAWAVDKDNPEQIMEAVKDILKNPDQARKVGETARKMVEDKYDWDNIARDMRQKVFNKILR